MILILDKGTCNQAPTEISSSTEWCNVDMDGLVDDNYKKSKMDICMEKNVARDIFNTSCSVPLLTSHKIPKSIASFATLALVTATILAAMIALCLRSYRQLYISDH